MVFGLRESLNVSNPGSVSEARGSGLGFWPLAASGRPGTEINWGGAWKFVEPVTQINRICDRALLESIRYEDLKAAC